MSFFYGPSPQYKQETQACIHHAARGILVVLPTQHHNVVNYSKEGILAGSYSCALMPRRNAFVLWIQRCCPHQQWQRKYWKLSEQMMTKHCDLLVCDSKNMERYIHEEYGKYTPKTLFISYGAEVQRSSIKDDDTKLQDWYKVKGLSAKSYYLVVGRFVPENNYETMIREFMKSDSKRDFALITNVSDKFLDELKAKTGFDNDSRIKFVGTVYDKELLKKIRENAYGYFHGHEVGGTNPSLLEALGSTDLNLLLKVGFNQEVAEDAALYWTKDDGNLAALINKADNMTAEEIRDLGVKSKQRIADAYSWQFIADEYEWLFLGKSVN